ncbi:MAG: hypothetical protein IPK32_21105 [Verrucomicrobiaceae bacterium]|nr:hypothetical protein [Verrucomicrobiaceae bacterium]
MISYHIENVLQALAQHPALSLLVSALTASSALVVAALAVSELLRGRSARSRSMIWRVALLGLLVLGLWRLMPQFSRPATVVEWEITMPIREVSLDEEGLSQPVAPITPYVMPEVTLGQKIMDWCDEHALHLWMAGAAFWVFWRLGRACMGMGWLRRKSTVAPQRISRLLQSLTPKKWPRCMLTQDLHTPMITGWLRPTIWLPAEAAHWPENRLRSALRHELAHLHRSDVPWHALARLTACVWWWQPLAWLARHRLHTETEHAADDHALMAGEDAAEYARTLVEIAAGMPATLPQAGGVPMLASSEVRQRVQQLMRTNLWRGRVGFGAMVALALVSAFIALVAMTKMEFTPKKPVFRSLAKLVAGGRMVADMQYRWEEQLQDFYGTIIETIESAEMQYKARERVHSLHPDLKDKDVAIEVRQTKGSAIFNILATGEDPKYTQIYLNALLDEFIAFRQIIREQAQGKVLSTFLQEVVNKQKTMEEKNEAFSKFAAANNILTVTNGNNEAASFLTALKNQREKLRTQQAELQLDLENIPVAASQAEHRATESGSPVTRTERDYLETSSEVRRAENELKFLLKSQSADHPQVKEATEKAAKARFLLEALIEPLREEMQGRLTAIERSITVIEKQIAELQKESLSFGAKMSEYEKLKKEADIAQAAYQTMFEKAENFQRMFNLQSDYVAIQERPTSAEEVAESNLIPVWKLWTPKKAPQESPAKK